MNGDQPKPAIDWKALASTNWISSGTERSTSRMKVIGAAVQAFRSVRTVPNATPSSVPNKTATAVTASVTPAPLARNARSDRVSAV